MRSEEKSIFQMPQLLQFQEPIVEVMEEAKEKFNLAKFCEKIKEGCQEETLPLRQVPALQTLIRMLAKGVGTVKNLEDIASEASVIVKQAQSIIRLLFALGLYIDKQPHDDHSLIFKIKLLILIHKICVLFPQENKEIFHFRRESYYQQSISYFTYDRITDKPLCGALEMAFQYPYPSSEGTQAAIQEMDWIGRLIKEFNDKFDKIAGGLQHKLMLRFTLLSHKMINIFSSLSDSALESDRLIAYSMLVTSTLKVISFSLRLKKYLCALFLTKKITDIVLHSTIDGRKITQSSRKVILEIAGDILQVYAYLPVDYVEIFILLLSIKNYFSQKNLKFVEEKLIYPIKKISGDKLSNSPADSLKEVKKLVGQSSIGGDREDQFLNQALYLCLEFDLQAEEKGALEWLSVSIQVSRAYLVCRDPDWDSMNILADQCLYLFLKYKTEISLADTRDYEEKLKAFTAYLAGSYNADSSGEKLFKKISYEQFLPLNSRISAIIRAADKQLFLQKDSKKLSVHITPEVNVDWLGLHQAVSRDKVIINDLLKLVVENKSPDILENYITFIAKFLININKLLKESPLQQTGDFELRIQALALLDEICVLFNDDVKLPGFQMWSYYLGIENYLVHYQYNHSELGPLFDKAWAIQCPEAEQKLKEIEFIYQICHHCLLPYASERADIIKIIRKFSVKMINIFLAMTALDFEEGEKDQFLVYLVIVNNIFTIIKDCCKAPVPKGKSTDLSSIVCLIPSLYTLVLKGHKSHLLTEEQSLEVLQAILNFFKIPEIFKKSNEKYQKKLYKIAKIFTPKEIKNATLSQCSIAISILEHTKREDKDPPKIEEKKAVIQPPITHPPVVTLPPIATLVPSAELESKPAPQIMEITLPQPVKVVKSLAEQMDELRQTNQQLVASSTEKTKHIRKYKESLRNLRKQSKQKKREIAELKATLAQRDEALGQATLQIAQLTQEEQSLRDNEASIQLKMADMKAELVIAKRESRDSLDEAKRLKTELVTTKQQYQTLLQQTTSAPPQNLTISKLEQELQELRTQLAAEKQKTDEVSAESKKSLEAASKKIREEYAFLRKQDLDAEHSLKYTQGQHYERQIAKLCEEITQLRKGGPHLQPPGFSEARKHLGFQYAGTPPVPSYPPMLGSVYEFRPT